jgi:hypothetical protein
LPLLAQVCRAYASLGAGFAARVGTGLGAVGTALALLDGVGAIAFRAVDLLCAALPRSCRILACSARSHRSAILRADSAPLDGHTGSRLHSGPRRRRSADRRASAAATTSAAATASAAASLLRLCNQGQHKAQRQRCDQN